MTRLSQYVLIITVNPSALNSQIKSNKTAECIKEEDPTMCCIQETHLIHKETYTETQRVKNIPCNSNPEKSRSSYSILIQSGFQAKTIETF